ncbi:MAG: hypothetical protein E7K47_15205, partial [Acidovorax sp.]|nr:hypothetical protein [Acidovorax sp.]
HQALGHELHRSAQHVDGGALLGEFSLCHCGGGHRVLQIKVDGSHLNLIRDHDGRPAWAGRSRATARYGLLLPLQVAAH